MSRSPAILGSVVHRLLSRAVSVALVTIVFMLALAPGAGAQDEPPPTTTDPFPELPPDSTVDPVDESGGAVDLGDGLPTADDEEDADEPDPDECDRTAYPDTATLEFTGTLRSVIEGDARFGIISGEAPTDPFEVYLHRDGRLMTVGETYTVFAIESGLRPAVLASDGTSTVATLPREPGPGPTHRTFARCEWILDANGVPLDPDTWSWPGGFLGAVVLGLSIGAAIVFGISLSLLAAKTLLQRTWWRITGTGPVRI